MTDDPTIRIRATDLLFDNGWGVLKSVQFDHRRQSGEWQAQSHIIFDIGDAAAVLPYDPTRGTVLLARQFRLPAQMATGRGLLLEVCAGKLDADDPETCARREAEEELGYRLGSLERAFEPFMSPGAVTERITSFLAVYSPADRVSGGGGLSDEGEDIEVVETTLDAALAMIARGEIVDAKTIMLLQHLKLSGRMMSRQGEAG
jgi:nudix-type nucleoside diphosphatase (YffH/AdpP family)